MQRRHLAGPDLAEQAVVGIAVDAHEAGIRSASRSAVASSRAAPCARDGGRLPLHPRRAIPPPTSVASGKSSRPSGASGAPSIGEQSGRRRMRGAREWHVDDPGEREPSSSRLCWKRRVSRAVTPDLRRRQTPAKRPVGERACGLADVPLDRVQAVAPVRDVRRADVLRAGGDRLRQLGRDQGAERDLEGAGARADADVLRAGTVDVDRVPADAHRVGEVGRPRAGLELRRHVLLDHRPESTDAPRLADVGMLRRGRPPCPSRRAAAGARARRGDRPLRAPRSAASAGSRG